MRTTRLLLPLLLTAAPLAAQKLENYRKLDFMAGCWHAITGKDQTVEEMWSLPTEAIMLGYTRYFTKGKATNWVQLHPEGGQHVYLILGPRGESRHLPAQGPERRSGVVAARRGEFPECDVPQGQRRNLIGGWKRGRRRQPASRSGSSGSSARTEMTGC
jgi:hypothetical protein